ncbi:uncharacterized protein si:ch73-70k4.1 [Antennarius striatus]|uniref:uncharacterized protein si:ch73-70k4.1 n=1 Tax=Antennarius striatus TaxID=241820 RepID=UPI0035B447FC
MSEYHSKSKLKRKKLCVEDQQLVKRSQGLIEISGDVTAQPHRPELSAGLRWTTELMSPAERLWALTLKSSLSHAESQSSYLVPDLPQPSKMGVTRLKLVDQRWCDINEDVVPFLELSPPSSRTSWSPFGLSSSQQDLSVQIHIATDLSDSQETSSGKTNSFKALTKGKPQTPHSLKRRTSSSSSASAIDKRVSLQEMSRNEDEVVSDSKELVVQKSIRGDESRLQSCPMCLLKFPAGFPQMDCDSHLAQCLSDMTVDVTW